MRLEWFLGLGAVSALAVLVGIDLALTVAVQRGKKASHALISSRKPPP